MFSPPQSTPWSTWCFPHWFSLNFLHTAVLFSADPKCHHNSLAKKHFPQNCFFCVLFYQQNSRANIFQQTVSVELRSFFHSWGRCGCVYINKREFCECSLLVSRVFRVSRATQSGNSFTNARLSLFAFAFLSLLRTDTDCKQINFDVLYEPCGCSNLSWHCTNVCTQDDFVFHGFPHTGNYSPNTWCLLEGDDFVRRSEIISLERTLSGGLSRQFLSSHIKSNVDV